MTFSAQIKEELCTLPLSDREGMAPELYAILISSAPCKPPVFLQTKHRFIADRFIDLLSELCTPVLTLDTVKSSRHNTASYQIAVENPEEQKSVFDFLSAFSPSSVDSIEKQAAFLRGSFISCGSISDPEKEYHLEFVFPNPASSYLLSEILLSLSFSTKKISRKNHTVLYLKESEKIEDLLTLMGSTNASLSVMGIKMLKQVRNHVNRATNCETANLDKTILASTRQMADIRLIEKTMGLSALPPALQEAAKARKKHPELSLRELCRVLPGKVSRSGLNHRFERLHRIALQSKTTQ